jgi:hypothetical protein
MRLCLRKYLCLPLHPELGITPYIVCCCATVFSKKDVHCSHVHLHNCKAHGAFTIRHDRIVDVILAAARSVNLTPKKEVVVSKPPARGARGQDLPNKRFDIVLPPLNGYGSRQLCLDVTVASHSAIEHITKARNEALYNLKQAIRSKGRKYATSTNHESQVFVALACETTGAIDAAFSRVLAGLGTRANQEPPAHASPSVSSFTNYWMQRVSVTLWTQSAQAWMRIATQSLIMAGAMSSDIEEPGLISPDEEDAGHIVDLLTLLHQEKQSAPVPQPIDGDKDADYQEEEDDDDDLLPVDF